MALVKVVQPRVSYADLERWPEDGRRYELYDGEVFVVPAPTFRHQRVMLNVVHLLRSYATDHGGVEVVSPYDVVFSDCDVVQPDVVFFRAERRALLDRDGPARVPPDLAVEVLSPSTEKSDRGRKMQMLARYGVPEYWLIDPYGKTVEVHTLTQSKYALIQTASESDVVKSATLAGLEFSAERVFADQ